MGTLKIEILDPKALQLIKEMQELKLIKVSDEPVARLKAYLKSMRKPDAPSLTEITEIVEEVRAKRHAEE